MFQLAQSQVSPTASVDEVRSDLNLAKYGKIIRYICTYMVVRAGEGWTIHS